MLRKLVLLIGALCMSASLNAAPTAFAQTGPALSVLPNGLKVLVQRDTRFPLVSLRLYVHAGSAFEQPEQAGISHLLEHMVFKGSEHRAAGQVAEDVEGAGGYLNASTSFDYTVYKIDVPAERIELGLDVLKDMTFGASIDPEELEREKKVVLAELERGEDSPTSRLFQSIQPMLWKGTPYAWPIIGYRDTVSAITRDNIRNYVARHYQPQSMLAVVCGDVNEADALALVEKYFGELRNDVTITPKQPLPLPENGGPRYAVAKGPWNKAYVALAFPLPSLHSDDVPGLDLLSHMLGGDDTSRLYRRFKYELGLVDSISAFSMTLDQAGMLYVSAVLDADKLEKFWTELHATLAALGADSFTDGELRRARLNLEDSLYSSKETIGGLTSKIGYFQFFENGVDAEDRYISRMEAVDRAELGRLIATYISPESMCVAVQLPDNGDEPQKVEASLAAAVNKAWPGTTAKRHADAAGSRGDTETIDLGNGHSVILQPDGTLPYTSITLVYGGGDALLFPDEQGLAALTANALTKGAGNLSAPQYEDFLSDRAAGISASVGRDMFAVSARYPSRFESDMLGLFANTLNAPTFADEEVDRARTEQVAGIRASEDQPLGLAFRRMFPFLFTGSGYGYLHEGLPEELSRFGAKEVKDFWSRQARQRWTLCVCGSFDREAILALANDIAAKGKAEPFVFPTPEWNADRQLELKLAERNQSHIIVVFPVPGSDSAETAGLDLLRQTLAGQGGLLFRELRDRQGLGYTVTAFLWQAPNTGLMAFYIGTYPDKMEQAMQGFRDTVAALHADTLPADVVDRARNLLHGDYYREHQSLSSRSREAAWQSIRGYALDHNRKLIDEAQTITPEALRELSQKYLDWDRAYVITVEP
ncbi:zinc protease [Desulfobaculum xiamenense]|uniref:Zinc protease n=1 Tax=Desulfobaculum xiamenense TaxID=995050 RepID=A0A846QLI0_9BACT|nr:pitrilysin family protein [Desulfobaculum xiamenense]NJB68961.1 zinc protease [Desulfobaculum xiamenense]